MNQIYPQLKSLLVCGMLSLCMSYCGATTTYAPAQSDIECLTQFVDAALKGDAEKAAFYMLKDSLNLTLLKQWHDKYTKINQAEKEQYAKASILVLKDSILNDSTHIIKYANSYKKIPMQAKIIHTQTKGYLLDLHHTFYGTIY